MHFDSEVGYLYFGMTVAAVQTVSYCSLRYCSLCYCSPFLIDMEQLGLIVNVSLSWLQVQGTDGSPQLVGFVR